MNGEGRSKTSFGLNIGTMVALLIAIVVGGFIVANVYDITKNVEHQSISTGIAVNKTLSQLLAEQVKANERGNLTISSFSQIIPRLINVENNIITSLTSHRMIENETRDIIIENQKSLITLLQNLTK